MVKWLFISCMCDGLLGLVCAIWNFVLFDRVVKRIYSENRSLWESLGKPIGFFWVPAELRQFNNMFSLGPGMARSSLFMSFSQLVNTTNSGMSAAEYSTFRVVGRIGLGFFIAAFACLALTIASIFL